MSIQSDEDLQKTFEALSTANKRESWIHSDLSITKSNAFGRIFWKVFAKHCDWFRRFFFNINLDESKQLLINLKDRVKQNKTLLESYNRAVRVFNTITSEKYHIPQEEIRELEIAPQPTPKGLIDVLNGAGRPSVDTLLKMITPETSNVRIYVEEPDAGVSEGELETTYKHAKIKKYSLATDAQIRAEKMPSGSDVPPNPRYNHTTTLTNIIATNELGFTPQEIALLVNKLIDVKADFTAIDYTNFHGNAGFVSIQNNPLKSLIALGSGNTDFDQPISKLIDYIGSLPKDVRQTIFSHKDRYVFEEMSPIYFLVRQGKEDIALKIVKLIASVHPQELILACQSFGTVPGKGPAQAECIKEMYKRLTLSDEERKKCRDALYLCSEDWKFHKRASGEQIIKTWPDGSVLCDKVLKKIGVTKQAPLLQEKLLQAYVEEQASMEDIGNQRFSGEYRSEQLSDVGALKYTYAQTEEGKQLLKDLLALMS